MAVGRLNGAWIRAVLQENFAGGVARKALLDYFSVILVSPRSHRGAKGRLARRLYGKLMRLQLRGLIAQEGGVVRLVSTIREPSEAIPRDLGPILERKLFRALLAEDGQGDGHTPGNLLATRRDFVHGAVEAGWTLAQAASLLGIKAAQVKEILTNQADQPAECRVN